MTVKMKLLINSTNTCLFVNSLKQLLEASHFLPSQKANLGALSHPVMKGKNFVLKSRKF
jgi:hypothetical protein